MPNTLFWGKIAKQELSDSSRAFLMWTDGLSQGWESIQVTTTDLFVSRRKIHLEDNEHSNHDIYSNFHGAKTLWKMQLGGGCLWKLSLLRIEVIGDALRYHGYTEIGPTS